VVSFAAHPDGKVLVPEEAVDIPAGGQSMVTLEAIEAGHRTRKPPHGWVEKAMELSRRMPNDLPEDLAEQHDHYIHGTPKRREKSSPTPSISSPL